MGINDLANAWARSERNDANRGKKVNQKGWVTLEKMRKNAAQKQAILAILLVILIVVIQVLAFLIKGLFSKNKFVKIFSAIGLLAFAIGTVILVKHIYKDDYTAESSLALNKDDRSPKTPMAQGRPTPFAAEQTAVREPSEHKSENAETRSMKTEEPISSTTIPEAKTSKVEDAPAEPPPVISSRSQAEPKPQAVVSSEKSPHFKDAKEHDWQALCQKEWRKTFGGIQRTFSVFGGFQLAQPPIDGIEFDTDSEDIQKDVPLQKKYRYFQKADLEFFHGALVEFTLKAHFAKKYSKESINRECEALQDDIIMNLKRLNKPELGVVFSNMNESWDEMDEWRYIKYGKSPNPSLHGIRGEIVISCVLIESDDGHDLTLSVNASDGLRDFIELVLEKEVDEAGEDPSEHKSENAPPRGASRSQAVPKPQTVVPSEKSPHFKDAKKHDWQALCQKEWRKTFSGIQRIFSVFGGFQLAQPPIDGIDFDTSGYHGSENFQKDVPLQKKYRYFQKADLEFLHGALVGFTLKTHFAKKYSKASIDREYKAFKDDVVKNLKTLHRPELGVSVGTFPPFPVRYGESRSPSAHNIPGTINTTYYLRQTDDGYDLTMTVNAKDGLHRFIELVLKNEADEAGDELEDFDKKQQGKVNTLSDDEKELEEQKRLEAQKRNEAQYERALAQMNQREKAAKDKLGRQYKMRMIKYNYYSAEFDRITNDYKKYRENLRIKYGIDKNE